MQTLYDAIVEGDNQQAQTAAQTALDAGCDPSVLLNEQMIPAMDQVGKLFEEEEYFVPELLMSARAMETVLTLITPRLIADGVKAAGRVVIGTVKGDLHDIGKNLVASMLKGAGFEVIDLGTDVSPERFVAEVKNVPGTIICLSALLTTTMPQMRKVVEVLNAEGLRAQTKVMIGGAPITQAYADEIGADGYSENASGAVVLARRLAV
ncbi:MAG: corrinoid protein [Thermoguttaceae bacterium]|nr:corrinoid protein [Thermoguttaceae bacterium]